MMLVGAYIRVSTNKQAFRNEGSLDTQEDSLSSFVLAKQKQQVVAKDQIDWQITDVYREEGKSAKNTNRPELQRLFHDIKTGRVNTVIVTKIDRITRSLCDFLDIWKFFEANDVTFVSLNESVDTSTPMGRAMVRIVVIFAEMEREQIAERVREKTEWRKEQGFYCGSPCLAYDFDPENRGHIKINEAETVVVRHIYEAYLKLGSVRATARSINEQGYRSKTYISRAGKPMGGAPFCNTSIEQILENPLYIGKVRNGGGLINGKHEGFLPVELWERVQSRLHKQIRTRHNALEERQYAFLLAGLIYCGNCDAQLTPRWAGGRSQRYFYYACTSRNHGGKIACDMKDVPAPTLDDAFAQRIMELGEKRQYVKNLCSQSNLGHQIELEQLENRRKGLERQLGQLRRKLQRWSDLLADSKDHGAEAQLLKMIGSASQEDQAIETSLKEIDREKGKLKERTADPKAIVQTLRTFSELFGAATDEEKRLLVRLTVHKVIWTPTEVKYALYEHPDDGKLAGLNGNGGGNISPVCSEWWTRAESNRRPGMSQRPLSYARSRRFISPPGLPSTGFRRAFLRLASRLHAPRVLRDGISHSFTSVLNPRLRARGKNSGDVAAVMLPERMPVWHLCFFARLLAWPTSIHGALQTSSTSRSKPVRAPILREQPRRGG